MEQETYGKVPVLVITQGSGTMGCWPGGSASASLERMVMLSPSGVTIRSGTKARPGL